SVAFAWNSQTNQFLTHGETWLNEPRLERDGRYIALTNSNSTFRLWDLATNTFGPTQSDRLNSWLGHNANLRGQWVRTDVNASAPFDLDRYYPSGGQIVKTRFLNNSAGAGVHHAGNWVQSDAELGGNLNRQWSFVGGVDNNAFTATALWKQAIGVMRADGRQLDPARRRAGRQPHSPGGVGRGREQQRTTHHPPLKAADRGDARRRQ